MNTAKRELHLAIQYREKILDRLKEKKIVSYVGNKYVQNELKDERVPSLFEERLKNSRVLENGVIDLGMWRNYGNYEFEELARLYFCGNYNEHLLLVDKLRKKRIRLYTDEEGNQTIPYIHVTSIERVLEEFHSDLIWIELPKNYRISSEYRTLYLEIIERQVDLIKNWGDKPHFDYIPYLKYYSGYKDNIPRRNKPENIRIDKGIWAYLRIYTDIDWDFDFLDKNIEYIDWRSVINQTNLGWSEEKITKLSSYFSFKKHVEDYSVFGPLRNEFIYDNRNNINWELFERTAIFSWNSEDLRKFYSLVEIPCTVGLDRRTGEPLLGTREISFHYLASNRHFRWTPELLQTAIELSPVEVLRITIENRNLHDLVFEIPDYYNFITSKVEICLKKYQNDYIFEAQSDRFELLSEYWFIFNNGGYVPHKAYKEYFTVDKILDNKDKWNQIFEERHSGMTRRPDTNYHYYKAINQWDCFRENNYVQLTYELCKTLNSLTIKLGGGYTKEDDSYLCDDYRLREYNALVVFSNHQIKSKEEICKIICDDELVNILLDTQEYEYHSGQRIFKLEFESNKHLLDHIIDSLNVDYTLEQYLDIVNSL